jgi:hypothetical protein
MERQGILVMGISHAMECNSMTMVSEISARELKGTLLDKNMTTWVTVLQQIRT